MKIWAAPLGQASKERRFAIARINQREARNFVERSRYERNGASDKPWRRTLESVPVHRFGSDPTESPCPIESKELRQNVGNEIDQEMSNHVSDEIASPQIEGG